MKFGTKVFLAAVIACSSPVFSQTAMVDFATPQQTIDGFGASSAWHGVLNSKELDAAFLNGNSNQLGLSILRVDIDPGGESRWAPQRTNAIGQLGILPFVPLERKLPASTLRATRRLDTAIAVASSVGMGQTVTATASKFRIKAETVARHLAYFMEIVRDDHRLGCAIPAHWEEAENTAPGLLNAAALRLSAELECGSLRPWCKSLKVTRVPTPYSTPTPV